MAAACSGGSDGAPEATPEAEAAPVDAEQGPQPTPTVGAAPTPYPDDAVVVGLVLADSFLLRDLDRQAGIAARAAVEQLNEAGGLDGREVVVLQSDTESRISGADDAARRFIEQGASLLLVTCDAEYALPAISRAAAADVLVISPCAADARWATGELAPIAFSMVSPAQVDGRAMADVAWANGWRSAVLLSDGSGPDTRSQCAGFRERWAALGGGIRADREISLGTVGSMTRDTELMGTMGVGDVPSDVVALCSSAGLGVRIIEQIRGAGALVPLLAGPTMDGGWRPPDIESGLGAYSVLTYASIEGDDPSPAVQAAIEAFQALDGAAPQTGRFIVGSDAISIFVAAFERSNSLSGAALGQQIRSMNSVETSSGVLSFGGGQVPSGRSLRVMTYNGSSMVFESLTAGS